MSSALRSPQYTARPPCGTLRLVVNGTEAALRRSGALWLAIDRTLIVADLHLEKGSSFAERGIMLPPYDTRATLARLEAEVETLQPRTVVLLGDTFHDARAAGRLAPDDAMRLTRLAIGSRTLVWIVGNHDVDGPGAGPDRLPGEVVAEVAAEGLLLRHEPRPGVQRGEVSGHLHPCIRVAASGRAVRRRAFLTDGSRLILPAFGAYAGGLNALDPAFSGMFARAPLAGALGSTRVHPIGWEAWLGD